MECIRFGARKGGSDIGCCGIDLFQGFNSPPDAFCTQGLTQGDSRQPLTRDGKQLSYGPTNLDVFLGYLRTGTFDTTPMPDKIFLAAMSCSQIRTESSKAWLRILKEHGFEFIRAVNNSVYTGSVMPKKGVKLRPMHAHAVYLFGLFRNISNAAVPDPFLPPQFWQDLPNPEKSPLQHWDDIKDRPFYEPPINPDPAPQPMPDIQVGQAKPW